MDNALQKFWDIAWCYTLTDHVQILYSQQYLSKLEEGKVGVAILAKVSLMTILEWLFVP